MPATVSANNLPILDLDLHIMHNQLILGAGMNDSAYLLSILKNDANVEYFIQQSAKSSNTINLLFRCLEILHGQKDINYLISNILLKIYCYCREQLDQNAKIFISNYSGLTEKELNELIIQTNGIHYYSDGVKRQRLEPFLNQENGSENSLNDDIAIKKHRMDANEPGSLSKRQRLKSPPPLHKRAEPLGNQQRIENTCKRKRFSKVTP